MASKQSSLDLALSYVPLAVNLVTQLFCVAGVNQLTSVRYDPQTPVLRLTTILACLLCLYKLSAYVQESR